MARYTKGGDVVRVPQINAELEKIEQAFENTLSRDGDAPNQMNAPIDMNGNKIVNVQTDITDPNSLVQRADLYTKVEVDALDAQAVSDANAFAVNQDNVVLAAAQAYAEELAGEPVNTVRYVQEELPVGPIISGARWYKPSEGVTYVYYVDEDSSQWVQETVNSFEGTLRTEIGVPADKVVSNFTLAELASTTLPVGKIVNVSERDNARFIVVSGETPNGFDILPTADLAVQLLDIPKPENMGIVADWNGTTGTDNTAAYLRYNTLCQEKGVSQNWKAGQYYFASVELPVSVDLKGEKGTEFFIQPAVDLRNAFLLDPDVIFKRVTIRPAITNSTKNFFENTFADDFDYHNLLMGFRMDDDCLAIDVQSLQMERGVTGRNGARNFKIVRGLYQAGEWGTSIFNCFDIQMLDVDVIGGNSGGMAMPSCKRVTVSGGTVINPDGTGVNTGGSAAVGFNAEDITVVNTRTYARDCINLENGCEVATITGNNVNVLSSSTSNGVGIGVHTRSGGGRVNQITVTGNTIRSTFGQYSEGIKLGDDDAGFDSYGFTVGHNTIEGCRRGILLENNNAGFKNYDFQVGPNKVRASDRAYSFYGTHEDGVIEGGILKRSSATTVSSTYGMELGTLKKVQINGVTTKGWSPHIRQLGTVTASKISQHTFLKGDDEANFLQLSNQSGGADITIDVTV